MRNPRLVAITITLIVVLSALSWLSQEERSTYNTKVAILQTIQHPALDATYQGIVDELKDQQTVLGAINIDYHTAQGSPLLAAQIAQKFIGDNPNILVGLGTGASQALANARGESLLPIVFSSVTDPVGAKLIKDLSTPCGSITGVSNFVTPRLQFEAFKELVPELRSIGIIYNPSEANSCALINRMQEEACGLQLVYAGAGTTQEVSQAALQLVGKIQAIFINNDNTALAAFDSILKIAFEHNIPVFCSDTDMVKRGALASLGPNQYQLGRQTGRILSRLLLGQRLEDMTVEMPDLLEWHVNQEVCQKLGIKPSEDLLKKAVIYP